MKAAIVVSFDDPFLPLGLGLILSLRTVGVDPDVIDIVHVDFGNSDRTKAALEPLGVRSVPFKSADYYSFPLEKAYYAAQVCRPVIPDLIPGYHSYLWLDSDTWIQLRNAPYTLLNIALRQPQRAVLSPAVSHYYPASLVGMHSRISGLYRCYLAALGDDKEEEAARYSANVILSSGVVAMSAACPVWSRWRAAVEAFFPREYYKGPLGDDKHGAEQLALNYVCYRDKSFVPADPLYNFHCNENPPVRLADGRVVTQGFPEHAIGVVHLAGFPDWARVYLARGLLFDSGRYLDDENRAGLERIAHYALAKTLVT